MKLVRFGEHGVERPGVMAPGSTGVLDATPVTADYDVAFFEGDGIERLRQAVASDSLAPIDITGARLGAPLRRPGKVVCIGLNYLDHAQESNMPIPAEPIIFMKAPNTIVGPHDDVRIPRRSVKTDWEVELGVVIGRRASYLADEVAALEHIAGYAVSNDVSEREFQLERGGQWDKGKSCDTFNPLGPWLVTADEVPDPQTMGMWLDVDGERMQTGHTSDMIFSVAHIVWYLSQFMVLEPGDIMNTGTPEGVGLGLTPPRNLAPGDEMHLCIAGLGTQQSRVVAP